MDVPMAGEDQRRRRRMRAAASVIGVGLLTCVAVAVAQAHLDRLSYLSLVLGLAAIAAGGSVARVGGLASVSASFIVVLLAAAFLGPGSACLAAAISEVTAAWRLRTARFAVAFNLLGVLAPALVAANMIRAIGLGRSNSAMFYLVVTAAGAAYLTINFVIVATFQQLYRGDRVLTARTFWEYMPSQALNIALAAAGAGIYVRLGLGGILFALAAIFAFSYMAHLLARARARSEQYVSLSWGVLAGLLRALDQRDQRSARHAAGVSRFASDIAAAVGMSKEQCELAHTAGLLHDIGHFALSDRVHERGRTLTEDDWMAIQRHPELGADMLKDLGMYGPVAEIVLAHHERVDGRGYPRGLPADEIPEIAKIIAVAEAYDTLTASDTYRTRMSSFEALRELRRVAGSQLDQRYVEVLADLLSGEGVEYRHADAADFDSELNMERRISEAGAGG
jgi:putative nucleotidyltransferase with HDIG domain